MSCNSLPRSAREAFQNNFISNALSRVHPLLPRRPNPSGTCERYSHPSNPSEALTSRRPREGVAPTGWTASPLHRGSLRHRRILHNPARSARTFMSQLCDLSARSILRQARPMRRNEDLLCEALAVPLTNRLMSPWLGLMFCDPTPSPRLSRECSECTNYRPDNCRS